MWYVDTTLNFHWLESTSVKNVAIIEKALKKLNDVRQNHEDDSVPVISLLNIIADLAKIKRSLLFDDIENGLKAIAAVNFTVKKAVGEATQQTEEAVETENKEEEAITLEEYHYGLVAQLVNTELCDLPEAIKITDEQPFRDIEGILKARIKFLNRDKEAELKKEKEQQELGKSITSELSDGSFFGGGFQDAVADAMDGKNAGLAGLL